MEKKLKIKCIASIFLGCLASLPFDGFWQSFVIAWIVSSLNLLAVAMNMITKVKFKEE